jgi:hypothetical protein
MSDLGNVARIAELIGDAKIVAIGENNHHVHEFGALRNRLLAHLVEHHGFRVLGFESGFAEGKLVDEWLRGAPGDVADIGRDGFTFSLGDSPEAHEMLTWLRERGDVRYFGLDVPSSAGSPVPSLEAVRAYLSTVDEAATGLVDAAIEATQGYASVSSAEAPGKYAALDAVARDKATATLSRLKAHLASLRPVYQESAGTEAQAIAEHHAEGALRVDTYLAEVAAMMAGEAPALQSGSRDAYMASTVRLPARPPVSPPIRPRGSASGCTNRRWKPLRTEASKPAALGWWISAGNGGPRGPGASVTRTCSTRSTSSTPSTDSFASRNRRSVPTFANSNRSGDTSELPRPGGRRRAKT